MKLDFLHEPDLEFGNAGMHVDVRYGLMQHGPIDAGTPTAPAQLRVGIVGTKATIEEVVAWLGKARNPIPSKEKTKLPNLFPPFPGFSLESPFRASVVIHERWNGEIHRREIDELLRLRRSGELVSRSVDLFVQAAKDRCGSGGPMVLICAPPTELLEALDGPTSRRVDTGDQELDESSDPREEDGTTTRADFHDLLKARGLPLSVPFQMVRPETYTGRKARRATPAGTAVRTLERQVQDEATRAWNFHTALYYKAGGTLWRVVRDPTHLSACFVGISFYKSLDGERVLTSVAQVFNERGEGLIVKGGPAQLDKDDRTPYLSGEDAERLILGAIQAYRREHRTVPARLVIHKTSRITPAELLGFRSAADAERIDVVDAVSVRRSFTRLFRQGTYPPLRGTFLSFGPDRGLLYLRGSVNFFETYPGMYVPRPLEFTSALSEFTPKQIAEEILALSKLNWNNTQFDGGEPITVRAARRVGDILKCVPEGQPLNQAAFRFLM